MPYATGYRRNGYRRSSTFTVGRIMKPNRRPGACRTCQEEIPAGGGNLYRETDRSWTVIHIEAAQGGWLMNPQPVRGGCPKSTDERNASLHASGFFGPDAAMPRSEREHVAELAARYAATAEDQPEPRHRPQRARYSSYERCNHEDYPCCGC